jgi:SNF2 family DNA or RNA helicase
MILPLATGNGLNITEANHVILVQPVLDRALEDQAIARALRLGQERTVWVHRFVAHDTIEEHVLRIADRQVLGGGGPEAEDEGITFADVEGIADAANPHSC